MSSERRRGWGGAEEGQALRELAPLKCGCLGSDDCGARQGLPSKAGVAWLGLAWLGLTWAGQGDLGARSLQVVIGNVQ